MRPHVPAPKGTGAWLRPWMVVAFNMALAAGLDAWGFFGGAVPGVPSRLLLEHLGRLGRPPETSLLWGGMVRLAARMPWGEVTAWMAGVSAFFGVACVGLLTALLLGTGYRLVGGEDPGARAREAWGRRLAGLAGGGYLAVCAPHWVASTRALPTTFHLFLLLGAIAWFWGYRRTGKARWLAASLFTWGVLAAQTATGWFLAPFLFCETLLEMLRWRGHRSWRAWLAATLGTAAGLGAYGAMAWRLARTGAYPGGAQEALGRVVAAPFEDVGMGRPSPSLLVFAAELAVPWCTLFWMSHRSPWHYERAETAIRLFFGAALAVLAWTPPFAPCFLVRGGLWDPPVAPMAVLAACFGTVAGETWIMGGRRPFIDNTRGKRVRRWLLAASALAFAASAWAAVARNAPLVRIPRGLWTHGIVRELQAHRGERHAMICVAPFDDLLELETLGEGAPWAIASAARTRERGRAERLAEEFASAPGAAELFKRGAYELGIRAWLEDPEHLPETLAIGRPDLYHEYGWLAPEGIATRIELSPEGARTADIVRGQMPLWERVAAQPEDAVHPLNPYAGYWRLCRGIIARQINDVAVRVADEGDPALADRLLGLADRVTSGNLSVKMNLERVGRELGLDEAAQAERREYREREMWNDTGARWGLGAFSGYVHDPDAWMREGVWWALSGAPRTEAGLRRKDPLESAVDGRFARWLDLAFMVTGREEPGEAAWRQALMASPWLSQPLLELARLSLRDRRDDAAEAYLREAAERGAKPEKVPFEWTMLDFVRLGEASWPGKPADGSAFPAGVPGEALRLRAPLHDRAAWIGPDGTVREPYEVFEALSRLDAGDMRVWMTLDLLAEGREPETGRIEKVLKGQRFSDPDLWLSLCALHIDRGQWELAREELNQAMRMNFERVALWELTLDIAGHFGEEKLAESAMNRLLRLRPYHYLAQKRLGRELQARGDLEGAARAYGLGVVSRRDPELLDQLAGVLFEMDPQKNTPEALQLVDEAIKRDPGHPGFRRTRVAMEIWRGDTDRALRDVGQLLDGRPPDLADYLLIAEICRARGDTAHARLALDRIGRLDATPNFDERLRLFAIRDWLAGADGEKEGAAGP